MKKKLFLSFLFLFSFTAQVFAEQIFELRPNAQYLYFSDSKITAIKSNNPNIIAAQKVTTFSGEETQLLFYTFKTGTADVQITTKDDTKTYRVIIKNSPVKTNSVFMELDMPTGLTEK